MSTHLHYQKFTLAECQDVEQLFEKLFAEPVTRNWFFLVLCSLLWGINAERQYYILFGCARNGKSGILNMLELVLGDYFGRFSSKALNERNDPSATSPELAAMGGKRAMVTSELKAGSQMEADILKALTGDDGLSVRGLYQDPRVLRMMAKILIASNHFPGFLNADKALRDRTVLIPLVALFDSLGAPADEFEQIKQRHFPADRNFRSTIQKIAPKLLFMLVDRYAQYKEVGLEPKPPAVKALTDGYWHAVGVQSRFILDCLGFDDGSKPEEILPAVATPTQHAQVVAPSVLPVAAPPARSKLTHTQAYNRFTGWAITRKMDITKYPLFTFKSLMDSELASMREHRIEFALDGWIGCFVKA
jgi:phage/plasmid-associated DNA primase